MRCAITDGPIETPFGGVDSAEPNKLSRPGRWGHEKERGTFWKTYLGISTVEKVNVIHEE